MIEKTRRKFTKEFKQKVAHEAIRGGMTQLELAKKIDIHPRVLGKWKRKDDPFYSYRDDFM
ncbi:transposase [Saprospira grandis]|uniref:transposase n=1 Tax=Saprospira grandis TaxID=1008 RepID=UPI000685C6FA|nr:transposase [Saprospira grandis]